MGHVAVAVAVMFDPRLKGFLTRASRAMRFETRRYCGSYPAGSLLWFSGGFSVVLGWLYGGFRVALGWF